MTTNTPQALVQRLWWLNLLRGVLSIALGLVAILWPGLSIQAFFLVFGVFSIVDGIVALGTGIFFRGTSWGWTLFQGIAGILIGLLAVARPQTLAAVIVIFLAMWALLIGLFQVAVSMQLRTAGQRSWLWVLISGSITALLGLYFLINPEVGAAFLAVTVGIFMLAGGIVLVYGAVQLRRNREELAQLLS
jgi:uncharacterized membrane protein HdeD (DUF308 family)